jgi:membrane associated rhomboid family serine protease
MLPIRDLNPTTRTPVVNWLIVAAAALVFFAVQPRSSGQDVAEFMYAEATIPCEIITAQPLSVQEVRTGTCNRDSTPAVYPDKRVYLSLLTAVFFHGGIGHLLGNLWVLWIFGNNVEDELGHVRYGLFYLVAGVVASLGHVLMNPSSTIPVVGASGAIAGVMGAYLVYHPGAWVVSIIPPFFFLPFRVPAAVFLVVWFLMQFLLAGGDTNIAWEAHVVGFGFGVIAAIVLPRARPAERSRWQR